MTGIIKVTVTDARTSNPLVGVVCRITGYGTGTTNASGVYQKSVEDWMDYTVKITIPAGYPGAGTVTGEAVYVGPNATVNVLFSLLKPYIQVIVKDASSAPIPGAQVSILSGSTELWFSYTDAGGSALAENITFGGDGLTLHIYKAGYLTITEAVRVYKQDANRFTRTLQIDTGAPKLFTMTVRVLDSIRSIPIPSVSFKIGTQTKTTNAAGEATFTLLEGDYAVQVSATGYVTQAFPYTFDASYAYYVWELALIPTVLVGRVTAVVMDRDTRHRVPGATVTVGGLSGVTDANGIIEFADYLRIGDYTITASAPGYDTATQAITVQAALIAVAYIYLPPRILSTSATVTVRGKCTGGYPLPSMLLEIYDEGVKIKSKTVGVVSIGTVYEDSAMVTGAGTHRAQGRMVLTNPLGSYELLTETREFTLG